jgi:hypothetical protein
MDYRYCEKVNLPMESLLHDMPKNLENFELTNGVILELKHFLEKNGKGVWELACLIPKLIPSFLSHVCLGSENRKKKSLKTQRMTFKRQNVLVCQMRILSHQ